MLKRVYGISLILIVYFLIQGCVRNQEQKSEVEIAKFEIDSSSLLMKYNDAVFSIPSPYQASILMKKIDYKFNKELLLDKGKVEGFSTNFQKALALGILGADIGYLMVYSRPSETIEYFVEMKELSDDLGLLSVVEEEFENYTVDPNELDSLIPRISKMYRRLNAYLTDNERNEMGALIIAGSWVESMYFLTRINLEKRHYLVSNRIGEQKKSLENLIDILSPYYYEEDAYSILVDKLVNLAYEFDGVICTYQYEPPVIDKKNKLTIINSESNVVLSEYHLNSIAEKIDEIRNYIVE